VEVQQSEKLNPFTTCQVLGPQNLHRAGPCVRTCAAGGVRSGLRGRGPSHFSGAPGLASDLPAAARPHNPSRILLLSGARPPPRTSVSSLLSRSQQECFKMWEQRY
ncbi:hypothetical protein HispidOSU_011860, partial [Sigmodon hispidus]